MRDRDPEVWTDPVDGRLRLRSVQACERHSWSILRAPTEPGAEAEPEALPFACKSWRCRRCGWWVARDDLRRLTTAATSRPWWVYLVLTFDPADFACGWDAYRSALERWNVLRRAIARQYGRPEYLQTWERHVNKNPTPHVNVLLRAPRLLEELERSGLEHVHDPRAGHGRGRTCYFPRAWRRDWLQERTSAAGFGLRVWAELVQDAPGMAAYLAKAARDLGAARWKAGDQTPIGAPPHFRRIRASRGLLPARPVADGLWTGVLSRSRLDGPVGWTRYQFELEAAEVARRWTASRPARAPEYERLPAGRAESTPSAPTAERFAGP